MTPPSATPPRPARAVSRSRRESRVAMSWAEDGGSAIATPSPAPSAPSARDFDAAVCAAAGPVYTLKRTLMDRTTFEALRDLPEKVISADIRFARRQALVPLLVAEGSLSRILGQSS